MAVRGELSGFSRAASGHCYFNLKDASGQIRCAMFRRSAEQVGFSPRDGELVEVRGRLGVYEQRGDLQLVVESMQRAGQGAPVRAVSAPQGPAGVRGAVRPCAKEANAALAARHWPGHFLGAAALHDVVTALRRRVPHIPVVIVPALVQGPQAPQSLVQALSKLYCLAQEERDESGNLRVESARQPVIDTILLVRGGGSLEDLWAFNDEQLARTIVQSPVPLISGVGHETDFTIADFAPTCARPRPRRPSW